MKTVVLLILSFAVNALIADLSNLPRHIDHPEIDAIIEKYRSVK